MQQQNRDLQWYAKELGLAYLAAQTGDVVKMAAVQGWTLEQTLQTLLEGEYERRLVGRQKARIKTAGFSQLKYLEQLDRNELPEGIKHLLPRLETLDFIHELAIKACMEGMHVLFTSVPHLITQIKECKSAKTLHQLEGRFKKYDLVVCDEFGYVSCDKEAGELLFNHLSLRADTKSTIITTNLAFDRWGEIIKDKVLVTALVDRLTHNAFLVNMNGESYRLKETKKFNEQNR